MKGDDDIFWIDFENYIKYFPISPLYVPLKSILSHYFKVSKENTTFFNVIKIKVEENGIFKIYNKNKKKSKNS